MSLTAADTIEIPDSTDTAFDHGALEPETRRVFIAHTARNCLEVVDADTNQHVATLRDFPEAAGVVADKGSVLVTNRGAASVAWVDARTLETPRLSPRRSRWLLLSPLIPHGPCCFGRSPCFLSWNRSLGMSSNQWSMVTARGSHPSPSSRPQHFGLRFGGLLALSSRHP
jgi:hypothetical protein